MIIGLMQPYFFPYIGYFELIARSDLWIVFDTVQYIRRGWMNRNRVLHPASGWQYVRVPVRRHPRHVRIDEVEVDESSEWRQRIPRQLEHYRRHAPNYQAVRQLIDTCLETPERRLSRLNVSILNQICRYVGIPFNYRFLSQQQCELGRIDRPGDWALRVCQALGAKEYLNPPGGSDLYCPERFREAGVRLTIQEPVALRYDTGPWDFVPSLSIIDVLMWLPRDEVATQLRSRADAHQLCQTSR